MPKSRLYRLFYWLYWNSANIVSFVRYSAPYVFFLSPWPVDTILLFYVILTVTDAIDGWLARLTGNTEGVGKFVDMSADKVLHLSALIYILKEGLVGFWMTALVITMIGAEVYIVIIVYRGVKLVAKSEIKKRRRKLFLEKYREVCRKVKHEVTSQLEASMYGKIKTIMYSFGGFFFLLNLHYPKAALVACYAFAFFTGLFFCWGSIVFYRKNFKDWKEKFLSRN